MTGKVLLDTSIIVAVLRRVPGVGERLRDAGEQLVPLVALGELEYGANLATPPESQRAAVSTFMQGATQLLPTAHTGAEYGRVKLALNRPARRSRKPICGSRPRCRSTACRSPPATRILTMCPA